MLTAVFCSFLSPNSTAITAKFIMFLSADTLQNNLKVCGVKFSSFWVTVLSIELGHKWSGTGASVMLMVKSHKRRPSGRNRHVWPVKRVGWIRLLVQANVMEKRNLGWIGMKMFLQEAQCFLHVIHVYQITGRVTQILPVKKWTHPLHNLACTTWEGLELIGGVEYQTSVARSASLIETSCLRLH